MRTTLWVTAAFLFLSGCHKQTDPLPGFPRLVLWAWERNENLEFLNPDAVGVAFLARTVSWRDGQLESRPRLQSLELPSGTRTIAVVRLESGGPRFPDPKAVTAEILKAVSLAGVQALQIDFDAKLSERDWYRQLISTLRSQMNSSMPLTITALASWCDRDSWIRDLPIDDAVPMLFRMGAGEPKQAKVFGPAVCSASFGISTDELPADLPRGRRLFVFHPRSWDEGTYRGVARLASKWN